MVFLVVLIALIDTVRCDYECLCSYNVEKPVFSTPTYVSGQKIGYMYEFDCKPTLKKVGVSDKMWTSIAFEHKVGFVESDPHIEVVTCPGDPASSDIVTTTIPTTAPLLLSSTIILSNSTISTIATLSTVTSSEASTTTSSTPFQTNSTTYNTAFHTYKTPLSLNITALVNSSSSSTPLVTSSTVLETTTIPLSRSTTNTYTNNTERKTPNTTPSTTIHMASTVTHDLDRSTTLSHISRTTGNIFISSTTRMTSQPKHSSTELTSAIRNHSLTTTDKATTSLQISTKRAIGTTNQNNITSTIPSSIGTIFSSPSTIHSSTQKSVIPSTTISPTLTALPHCPYHWTLHAGSCYLFHTDDRRIWTDAEDLCLRHNSHLVYIESKAENTYIVEHLKGLIKGHDLNHDSSSATWIGGSDELLEKTWVWYGIDQPITYSDWGPGEPDSGDGHHEEDCISIVGRRNWHWHDFSCDKQMNFICERPSYYTSSPLYVG